MLFEIFSDHIILVWMNLSLNYFFVNVPTYKYKGDGVTYEEGFPNYKIFSRIQVYHCMLFEIFFNHIILVWMNLSLNYFFCE